MKEVKKMNPYILSLEHKQASLEMVGGKGMSLSKLLTAGIPVPDGSTGMPSIALQRQGLRSHLVY